MGRRRFFESTAACRRFALAKLRRRRVERWNEGREKGSFARREEGQSLGRIVRSPWAASHIHQAGDRALAFCLCVSSMPREKLFLTLSLSLSLSRARAHMRAFSLKSRARASVPRASAQDGIRGRFRWFLKNGWLYGSRLWFSQFCERTWQSELPVRVCFVRARPMRVSLLSFNPSSFHVVVDPCKVAAPFRPVSLHYLQRSL